MNKKIFFYRFEEDDNVIKVHQVQKKMYTEKDISRFIDEQARAVMERNVKGVIIPLLLLNNEIMDIFPILESLGKKVNQKGYEIATIDQCVIKVDDTIILLNKISITLLILILCYLILKPHFISILIFSMLVSLIQVNLFYMIIAFILFYLLNDIFLQIQNKLTILSMIGYIGSVFIAGMIISNYLFDQRTCLDPSSINGIKIIFLMPLILFFIQYQQFKKINFIKIINQKISWLVFGLTGFFSFLLLLLVLRSNHFTVNASLLEMKIREFAESLFFIRPRFKEILLYPFLVILYIFRNHSWVKKNKLIFLMLIVAGSSSTINSFLHIHTLSYYTMIRSLTGISIGFVLGISGAGLMKGINHGT